MEPTTKLVLIRHAEVEERYHRVFGGRLEMDLSPLGQNQAAQLAHRLRECHFAALYVSPQQRARQTAAPIVSDNGTSPVVLEELREVDFGEWTGLRWEQVQAQFDISPFDWLSALDRGSIRGAEPAADFRRRTAAGLARILAAHPSQTVAVVAHGGVIRGVLAELLRLPLPSTAAFRIDYASITVLACHPSRTEIQLLNHTPWRQWP
ncbi:MAG: histidine phosphatase family protein [Verrucomicrobia bacterium]|nr:histidine phosphatase family protein [Verrucomicrobiota bacterium]